MKRLISIFLVLCAVFVLARPIKACIIPFLPPGSDNYIVPGIYSGVMASAAIGNVIRAKIIADAPKLKYGDVNWNVISLFESDKVWTAQEALFITKLLDKDTLLAKNMFVSAGNIAQKGNHFNVKDTKSSFNENEHIIILPVGEIKNNSLNIYYFKLPEQLVNSKKPINIEAASMFQIPERFQNSSNDYNYFDFMILPKDKYDKITATISKKLINKEIVTQKTNYISLENQENIKLMKKDFSIKKKLFKKHDKDFVFVVCQHGLSLKDDNLNHIRTFNAVLKMK